ncbi:MAG: hypothetical protein ABI091_02990, partial [Ferruginibacter sp.]
MPKSLLIYLLKFLGIFCLCYFGTLAVIGIAAPGGRYSPFVDRYLDYVNWLKASMINATGFILSVFNVSTQKSPGYAINITGGPGIYIAMDCVGYGVYSFWIAFVAANTGGFWKKAKWIAGGLLALWLINVLRITLYLVTLNKGIPMPLGIDHHTWFTIAAYIMIFLLIILYD